jgi:hypothetical protein
MISPVRQSLWLLFLVGGCEAGPTDPARASDLGESPPDLSPDLSVADLSPADLAASAPDLAMNDLSTSPDLSSAPDLASDTTGCASTGGVPDELRCTGLYASWASRTIAGDVATYKPGFELWSDGAQKARYIRFPPSGQIDVSDPNNWQFPVGTKLWKEFRVPVNGVVQTVETRMLWRIDSTGNAANDWVHTSYAWAADLASTARVSAGVFPVAGTASATAITGSSTMPYAGYEIPSESQCVECHSGSKGFVLGMSAVLMAAPEATGLTYATLQAGGKLTDLAGTMHDMIPSSSLQIPGSAVERTALGNFQANCGVCCHNQHIATSSSDQHLRIDVDDVTLATPASVFATDSATSTINVPVDSTSVYPAGTGSSYYRLRPTDPSRSGIYYRDGQRETSAQMPPLCTHAASDAIEAATAAWIAYMTPANGYPAPAP